MTIHGPAVWKQLAALRLSIRLIYPKRLLQVTCDIRHRIEDRGSSGWRKILFSILNLLSSILDPRSSVFTASLS